MLLFFCLKKVTHVRFKEPDEAIEETNHLKIYHLEISTINILIHISLQFLAITEGTFFINLGNTLYI